MRVATIPHYSELRGVVADLDNTIINTSPPGFPPGGLHGMSRLAAVHEIARQRGITPLAEISVEQNRQAFIRSKVHSLEGGIWEILKMAKLVEADELDPENELVIAIADLKDEMHEQVLLDNACEVPGATQFYRKLAHYGVKNELASHMAIASSAIPRDVELSLEALDLRDLFPDERITNKMDVAHGKPHPEPFNRGFKTLKLPESARPFVIAIEDDPRGATSAKAARLPTLTIASSYTIQEMRALATPPDYAAENYAELEEVLGLPPGPIPLAA